MSNRGMVIPRSAWVKNKPAIPNKWAYDYSAKLASTENETLVIPAGALVNPVIDVYGYPTSIVDSNICPNPPDEAMAIISNVKTTIDWYATLFYPFSNFYETKDEFSFYNYSILAKSPSKFHCTYRTYVALPNRIKIDDTWDMFLNHSIIAVDRKDFSIKLVNSVVGFLVDVHQEGGIIYGA